MPPISSTLEELGWRPFFQRQIPLESWDRPVMRVAAQHRDRLELLGPSGAADLHLSPGMPPVTVGDWLVLSPEGCFESLLGRQSLFSRKAAGRKVDEQLIAANVDTVFVVTSLDEDFNLNRIERYLSLVHEAGATPVVVLTKADLCPDTAPLKRQVQNLDPLLVVEAVNGLDTDDVERLAPWCGVGETVALMGSSGVGKSTLVNGLLGREVQRTGAVREADSKGRHVTTGRSLHRIPTGGWLLDTPGMRELQLADCHAGLAVTFTDIESLAKCCRFGDCRHDGEPGCAVQDAIDRGELDARRLASYRKLLREQAVNAATLAEKHARDRRFGKMIKAHLAEKRRQGR
jgi:ribosome biogenesis GTPase